MSQRLLRFSAKEFMMNIFSVRERNTVRAGSQRLFGIVLLTVLFTATSYADPFTFSTIPPSGSISGAAGSTVGWGYTATNNSTDQWLMFTNLGTDAAFSNGTPNIVFDFPVVAPNTTVTMDYDGTIDNGDGTFGKGLFEFTWNADAPAGSPNSGNFVLTAELYSGDPFDAGEFQGTIDFSVPYSVTVPTSCECTPVPESSSLPLLACGVGGLHLFGINRKKIPLGL